ncbi:hypothetical protein OHB06_50225 [Streptomyces sp. NBC_01604]|uniref:hypothetical protein n=1 Tax=unclassified Streptomyces TaxID=2593676 RepID=UPI00386DB0DF
MDATRTGGFGWHLVQGLSADVQVKIHASGKTVTAIVPCPTGTHRAEERLVVIGAHAVCFEQVRAAALVGDEIAALLGPGGTHRRCPLRTTSDR